MRPRAGADTRAVADRRAATHADAHGNPASDARLRQLDRCAADAGQLVLRSDPALHLRRFRPGGDATDRLVPLRPGEPDGVDRPHQRGESARQGSVESLLAVDLPAHDSLLDAIAFSRGRFMIEVMGEAPLFLPAWPEISRVIDDCR